MVDGIQNAVIQQVCDRRLLELSHQRSRGRRGAVCTELEVETEDVEVRCLSGRNETILFLFGCCGLILLVGNRRKGDRTGQTSFGRTDDDFGLERGVVGEGERAASALAFRSGGRGGLADGGLFLQLGIADNPVVLVEPSQITKDGLGGVQRFQQSTSRSEVCDITNLTSRMIRPSGRNQPSAMPNKH